MTRNKEYFSQLKENDMQLHIELGDDGSYLTKGMGIVSFESKSSNSIHLKDVLYVPSLKKNLVFVSTPEDKGYDVIFSKGKPYLKHLASGAMKQIGVRVKNLYKLQVETEVALRRVHGRDMGELWHKCMGHLHHGALKILQQIAMGLRPCRIDQHEVCKGYTLSKYAKSYFQGQDSRYIVFK